VEKAVCFSQQSFNDGRNRLFFLGHADGLPGHLVQRAAIPPRNHLALFIKKSFWTSHKMLFT
jgi:hypothetical protein